MHKRISIILASLVCLYLPVLAFAETIVLKSGKRVEGKIVEKIAGYVKIDFQGVLLTYFNDEIESVDDNGIHVIFGDAAKVEDVQKYSKQGLAYLDQGQYDKAIQEFNKAIELDPNLAQHYYNRGKAYSYTDNLDQALSDARKALELKPDYYDAYCLLGLVNYGKHNVDEAILDLSKAVILKPNSDNAFYMRGLAYLYRNDLDKAISDFDSAINNNPKSSEAYTYRAVTYLKKQDYDKAWEDVSRVKSLGYEVDPKFIDNLKKASGREN